MNENLLVVTITGYFVCLAVGCLVGQVAKFEPGKDTVADTIAAVIYFAGLIAAVMMLASLIMGFVEGVS